LMWLLGAALLGVGILAARWWRARTRDRRSDESRRQSTTVELPRRWTLNVVATSLLLTVVAIVARSSILPVVALTLSSSPPFGVMVLASIGASYGQVLLPTPAGAGIVDVALLRGAAGDLGAGAAHVLLAWRIYTVVLPLVTAALWVASDMFRSRRASAD